MEGADCLYSELSVLNNQHLQEEAKLAFEDALGWLAIHFELTVHQLELLRGLDQSFLLCIGANLGIAILTRRPVVIDGFEGVVAGKAAGGAGISIASTIVTTSHAGKAAVTSEGEVAILYH